MEGNHIVTDEKLVGEGVKAARIRAGSPKGCGEEGKGAAVMVDPSTMEAQREIPNLLFIERHENGEKLNLKVIK